MVGVISISVLGGAQSSCKRRTRFRGIDEHAGAEREE